MTTSIASLRIQPDFDASKYVSGANQKADADRRMIDSSKSLSSALNDNVQKISTATGGLEQLLRKTVPGYQANAEFERGLRQLNAGLDKGRISMSLAAEGLSGLISRYGQVVTVTDLAERGQLKLVDALNLVNQAASVRRPTVSVQDTINRTTGVNLQPSGLSGEWAGTMGGELDRLRAKFNPLYSAIQSYKTSLQEIREAHALGAISADEMSAAISRERQATLSSIEAIKLRNGAKGANQNRNSFQATNVAYQLQDIVSTAALGSSPLTVALQQGPQLASVFGGMGAAGAVSTLAEAFTSLISPVSLVTIGLTAAGAAAIGYFASPNTDSDKLKAALDSHIQALRDIKELWPSALAGLQDYISESPNVVRANAQDSLNAMKLAVAGQASQTERNAAQYITNFASAGSSATSVREFTQAIQELHSSIATGNPNLLQFRDHMAKIIVALDTSENEKGLAKTLFEMPDDVIKGAKAIPVLESALANMGDTSARSAAQLKTFTDAAHELANIGLPNMTDAQRALKAYNDGMANASGVRERMSIKHLYDESERRRLLNNPQTAANDNSYSDSMQNLRSIGLPPLSELDQARKIYERAKSLATTREAKDDALLAFKDAQFRIENPQMSADQWRDLMSGADDKVEALKQEATALGKTGVEAQALRFQLDLLQKAEEKGRNASAAQREEINKKTDLFRQYATALAKAKLNQDLLNERQQILRSPQDQQIATRLQQAGLPVDLNSPEAQMMRQNADLTDLKSNVHAFATDFREALLNNGGDIGDAFASALKNALMNKLADIFDKSIENMLNAVLSGLGQNFSIGQSSTALTSQSQSGSFINGLVSAVVGGVKTAGASIGVAANSIGSSSSISLANARAAIASIESGGNFGALGPLTKSGDRAYGAYQVMGNNIPSWTKSALGYSMTPSQFLANPAAQNSVFNNQFGGYYNKTGSWNDAASMWFSGRPLAKAANASDILGTTTSSYVQRFNDSLNRLNPTLTNTVGKLGDFGGSISQLGGGLSSFGQKLSTASFPSAPGGSGGGGLFGGISSLFSGLFGSNPYGLFGTQYKFALAHPGGGLWDKGGWTGAGQDNEIAGAVHKNEYVFSAPATARIGVANLEAMHRSAKGFASGGFVGNLPASMNGGGGVVVNIVNNSGASVQKTERKTAGGTSIDVMIDDAVASNMAKQGSATRKMTQAQFGMRTPLATR